MILYYIQTTCFLRTELLVSEVSFL